MERCWIPMLLLLWGCDKVPDVPSQMPGAGQEISVAYLKTFYRGGPTPIEGDYRVRGRVVSSDRTGNFYRTLVIEDESGGIELRHEAEHLYVDYPPGCEIVVRCNGLWLGEYGGTIQIGARPGGTSETDPLTPQLVEAHTMRTTAEMIELIPRLLTYRDISPRYVDCLVRFEEVQFPEEEIGLCWTDSGVDTDRTLVFRDGNRLAVRTLARADFAGQPLPEGSGTIEGVLGRFGDRYQLRIIFPEYVFMDEPRF